jgi:hypothetical protein
MGWSSGIRSENKKQLNQKPISGSYFTLTMQHKKHAPTAVYNIELFVDDFVYYIDP